MSDDSINLSPAEALVLLHPTAPDRKLAKITLLGFVLDGLVHVEVRDGDFFLLPSPDFEDRLSNLKEYERLFLSPLVDAAELELHEFGRSARDALGFGLPLTEVLFTRIRDALLAAQLMTKEYREILWVLPSSEFVRTESGERESLKILSATTVDLDWLSEQLNKSTQEARDYVLSRGRNVLLIAGLRPEALASCYEILTSTVMEDRQWKGFGVDAWQRVDSALDGRWAWDFFDGLGDGDGGGDGGGD